MNADLERLIALQKLDSTADAARKKLAAEPEHELALEARLEAARHRSPPPRRRWPSTRTPAPRSKKTSRCSRAASRSSARRRWPSRPTRNTTPSSTRSPSPRPKSRKSKITTLERMMEADDLAAALKTRGSAARRGNQGGRRRAADRQRRAHRDAGDARADRRRARRAGGRSQQGRARDVRSGVAQAQRGGDVRGARRRLHHLPRPARPQVFNTVLRNDSILQCDHCNRILYYVPIPASAATAPADPSPQAT